MGENLGGKIIIPILDVFSLGYLVDIQFETSEKQLEIQD